MSKHTIRQSSSFSLFRAILTGLLLCCCQALNAQSNVRLAGIVYDADSGMPLMGVNIQVETTLFGAVSDDDGYFRIENIPPGSYTVVVSMLGYADVKRSGVAIREETPQRLSVALKPTVIKGDSVTVLAHSEKNEFSFEGEKIVLNEVEIERYRSLGLPQLLQQVAGVQVESTGGGASPSFIKIHGSGASQVLVLLDGQRLNEPQTGTVDLNDIPLEQIERIEIIRQGNAAMYGGNAFDGIVSFKTRRVNHSYGILRSQAGSFSSARGGATLGISLDGAGFIGDYQQDYSRQNFSYLYEGNSYQRQNAWYRNRKAFAKLNRRFGAHQVNILYNFRQGTQGLPSAFFEEMNPFDAYKEGASHAVQLNNRWLLGSKGYLDGNVAFHYLKQFYDNEADISPFTRYKFNQKNEVFQPNLNAYFVPLSNLETRLGVQYLKETLDQQNLLFPAFSAGYKQRHTTSGYGSIEFTTPSLKHFLKTAKLRSALRYERYFDQPGEWYPLLGFSMVPAALPSLSISSSWAKAIRYPDFNSLFWKGDARAQGNPDLLPERKTTWNVSARFQPFSRYLPALSVYYYSEKINDLIFWHRGVNGVWEPRNEERAEKQGVDVQLEQPLLPDQLHLQVAYSYVDAINKSEEPNRKDKRIVFIPQHTLNTSMWCRLGKLHSLLVYRYASERETVAANTGRPLAAYQLWDLSLSWRQQLAKILLEFGLAVKNFSNTNYQLLRGYPMPGREFQFSVQLTYNAH